MMSAMQPIRKEIKSNCNILLKIIKQVDNQKNWLEKIYKDLNTLSQEVSS